ncbi:MAG: hypothetical protein PHC69_04660 [Ruminiclostridium sp.]|nr:hypothetical protein [Ruminiclostridium sp.]
MGNGKVTVIDTHENLRDKNEIYDLLYEQQYSILSRVDVQQSVIKGI